MAEKKFGVVSRLLGRDITESYRTQLESAQRVNEAQSYEVGRLQESVRELSLYLEDLKWTPINGWGADDSPGFSIEAIKEQADHCRSLVAINPTIKKAVNARVGYIWGRGFRIDAPESAKKKLMENPRNAELVFDEVAQWTIETHMATDGNLWVMREKRTENLTIVPLDQIAGWVTDEDDDTRVTYWLRKYTRHVYNFSTGEVDHQLVQYWVPAYGNTDGTASRIQDIPVNRDMEMVHVAANRQTGWILGVSDIMAVMFWARNHKELYEAGSTFVKAQGKYAAKVIAKTGQGGQAAAATLRDAPRRDPMTGESYADAGGTAVLTGGLDYQLMGKMSGGVDFESFDPIGGLVAAGLGIPRDVLLAKAENADIALEPSTVEEMRLRQKLWSRFYKSLFKQGKAEVVWPKIRTEPEYRRIQSVEIANKTNTLHRTELRLLTLEAFGLEGDPADVPKMEDHPDVVLAKIKGKNEAAQARRDGDVLPDQGVTGEVGKLSNGDDAKDARDNPLDSNVQNQ